MRNAIITGASSGIGKALATNLAQNGYNLALIADNNDELSLVSSTIKANNPEIQVRHYSLDVFNLADLLEAITNFKTHFKSIDVLINNAGILKWGSAEILPEKYQRMVNTNLIGFYNVLHCCVPILKEQKFGYVINMSSMSGTYGVKGLGGYCSTKYGVAGFSASLYKELVPLGIQVTYLCPGVVDTPLTDSFPFKNEDQIATSEICKTVSFLLSLDATVAIEKIEIASTVTVNPNNLNSIAT